MATPSAILSILVSAKTAEAVGNLSKFDRQLAATDRTARKGIEARLGARLDSTAFKRYESSLANAARRSKDREAFKAQLGANFNNTAFNRYERALDRVKAKTEAANAEARRGVLGGVGAAAGGAGGRLIGAASFAAGASLGFGAIAKGSLDAQVQFQRSMELIRTQAGATQREVDRLSKSVASIAPSVGTGPNVLATGLYHLESQGLRGAKAMNALRIAAEGAKIGNANLEDVTNGLGAAIVSGLKGTRNFSGAMGQLNAIVGAGDMHMQDLADALSTGILGPMKTFGLSLKDVGGALATFGDNNIRGQDAATKLISAVRIMAAPSKAAAKELSGIGLSTLQLANDMRSGGLVKAFTDLRDHLNASGKSATEQGLIISRAFGGRQSTGVQLLLGQLDRLRTKTGEVGAGAGRMGEAWKATTHTLAFQLDRTRAIVEVLGITLGKMLAPAIPILNQGIQAVLGFVQQMQAGKGAGGDFAKAVSTAFGVVKSVVLDVSKAFGGLGNVIKGVAIALGALAIVKTFTAIVAGISPATLALVAMAAAAALIVDHWKTVGPFFANLWHGIRSAAEPVIQWIVNAWNNATSAVSKAAHAVFPTVKQIAIVAFDAIKVALAVLKTAFDATWNVIGPLVRGVINGIRWGVNNLLVPAFRFVGNHLHTLASIFSSVFGTIKSIVGTVMDFVLGALSTFLHGAGGVFDLLSKIPILGGAFDGLGNDVRNAGNKIDELRRQLRNLPTHKTITLDVKLNRTTKAFNQALSGAAALGNTVTHRATGGMVTRPGYFAGEEAPRHPEVVLATNPAYRQRNVGLWQKAGRMLGVRGFATGGITSPASLPSQGTVPQIRLAELANALQLAQNANNVPGQQKALTGELRLDQSLLSMDKSVLAQLNKALRARGLSRAKHARLLADKLALVQEIGNVISSIGSANSTLTGLTGSGGAGGGGTFDLAPGGGQVNLPTSYDVHRSMSAAGRGAVHHNANTFNIHVKHASDVPAVEDAIERALGSQLHSRLRSAGMRGS